MLQAAMDSKTFKILYGIVFPIGVVVSLLGIASFNNRPRILGSTASDLIIRLLLTIWFCVLYIRLSRISSFSYYPNKKWTKADIGPLEKYAYLALSAFFSGGCGIVTWWMIHWFLLSSSGFSYAISVVNSLIILIPLATHYWVLKL